MKSTDEKVKPDVAPVPRLALGRWEAAHALGISVDFFDDHVDHELRCVRRGRKKLYAVTELEQWLEKSADRVHAPYSPYGRR